MAGAAAHAASDCLFSFLAQAATAFNTRCPPIFPPVCRVDSLVHFVQSAHAWHLLHGAASHSTPPRSPCPDPPVKLVTRTTLLTLVPSTQGCRVIFPLSTSHACVRLLLTQRRFFHASNKVAPRVLPARLLRLWARLTLRFPVFDSILMCTGAPAYCSSLLVLCVLPLDTMSCSLQLPCPLSSWVPFAIHIV